MTGLKDGSVRANRAVKPAPGLEAACPSAAIRIAGREMTLEDAVREVMKDAPFFAKSGGGATFSGGEPLTSPAFARELADLLLKRGISVAIETCLAVAPKALEPFLDLPILWLADLKHVDAARFREGTGGDLALVNRNMSTLAGFGADLELRIPLVPGFNADDATVEALLSFAAGLPNPGGLKRRIDFLPYHELALGKFAMLDREYPWKPAQGVDRHDVTRWESQAAHLGFVTSTGG